MTVMSSPVALQTDGTSVSSFRRAMLLLSRDRRKALHTLYMLCRALDDAVDNAPSNQEAQERLAAWKKELETAFSSATPQWPLACAFQQLHRSYHFDKADMDAMLAAFELDARGDMVAPSMEVLERYCYGVAGAVGLMAMRIFGCKGENARSFAVALGHALQLTNILRDVIRDAQIGRIYLPREFIGENITPAQLSQLPGTTQNACAALAILARKRFEEADRHAARLPARAIAPALAMRDVYALYWHALERVGWHPPIQGNIRLNYSEKALLALRACGYLFGRYRAAPLPPCPEA